MLKVSSFSCLPYIEGSPAYFRPYSWVLLQTCLVSALSPLHILQRPHYTCLLSVFFIKNLNIIIVLSCQEYTYWSHVLRFTLIYSLILNLGFGDGTFWCLSWFHQRTIFHFLSLNWNLYTPFSSSCSCAILRKNGIIFLVPPYHVYPVPLYLKCNFFP